MKNIFKLIIVLLFSTGLVTESKAQLFGKTKCKSFATTYALGLLDTLQYTPNGRYTALKLYDGDEVRMFKTISRDLDYRAVVALSNDLPEKSKIQILDFNHKVLKTNEKGKRSLVWDFTSETTQRLIIAIKIPAHKDENIEQTGCVAIMFGVKK